MPAPRRIALSGLELPWGLPAARLLATRADVEAVWLLDGPEGVDEGVVRSLRVDIGAPDLAERLEEHGIDAVICAALTGTRVSGETAFRRQLGGAMRLASAAAAAGARRIVLRSSARAYGAWPDNPVRIGTGAAVRAGHRAVQHNRVYVELERFADGFCGDWPDVELVRLRCAPVLAAGSPAAQMLTPAAVVVLAGFDPMMQLLDADAVAGALVAAVCGELPAGVVHVAPDDALALSQVIARCGRRAVPVPHPIAYGWAMAADALGTRPPFPLELEWMRYGAAIDPAGGWAVPRGTATAVERWAAGAREVAA